MEYSGGAAYRRLWKWQVLILVYVFVGSSGQALAASYVICRSCLSLYHNCDSTTIKLRRSRIVVESQLRRKIDMLITRATLC